MEAFNENAPHTTWRQHAIASLKLGLPLIGSNLAQLLIHITDVVMLGHYSVDDLAAAILASQLFYFVFIVGSGFAFAAIPMAAKALGSGDQKRVRSVVRMTMWLCLIYATIMSFLLWFSQSIFLAAGQTPELSALGGDYLRIALWALFPALSVMVLKSWFSALERTGIVLVATLIAAVANVGVNYLLIFGNLGFPEMGIRGAAISSVLTTLVSAVVLTFWSFWRAEYRAARLYKNPFRADWPVFAEVFRLGWPISLTMLAETGLFVAATLMIGWTDKHSLAAHGIVARLVAIMFMIPLGISNVATIRVGRALGRSDIVGLQRATVVVLAWTLISATMATAAFLLMPEMLISLFLGSDEPQRAAVISVGTGLLFVAAAFQIADALQVTALGMLRGLQDTTVPMTLAMTGYWVLAVPCAYVFAFPLGYGAQGVWAGLCVGLIFAAVAMLYRYWTLRPLVGQTL